LRKVFKSPEINPLNINRRRCGVALGSEKESKRSGMVIVSFDPAANRVPVLSAANHVRMFSS